MTKHKTIDLGSLGMIRIATAVPSVLLGDCVANTDAIITLFRDARKNGASIVAFPELCITGYTLGDLLQQDILLEAASKGLSLIAKATIDGGVCIVGLPLRIESKLFNVAAVCAEGKVVGIIPKTNLPEYKEFYEKRWFASGRDLISNSIKFFGYDIPVGTDLLFASSDNTQVVLGVEICEDVWTPLPPSSKLAVAGATVLVNLSASNELVGKAHYRRNLVLQQSARTISAYVYVSSGIGESTTDTVFSGHCIVAENGSMIAESVRYQQDPYIMYADIDIAHCMIDRIRTTSFGDATREINTQSWRTISLPGSSATSVSGLERKVPQSNFIPESDALKQEVAEEVFNIQVAGLTKRMKQSGIQHLVLGLSGGLDSTLALLVGIKALEKLSLPATNMHIITMPGFGTTDHTKSNTYTLAGAFKLPVEEISIVPAVTQHLADIGHDGVTENNTYENAQARYRTMILMDKANELKGFVMGTGDLSEIALGWNTFTGDHTAPYNVNAGVPKTLVQHVVAWMAKKHYDTTVQDVIQSILDTPISPELTATKDGQIAQKTEELVGPYELHDFFLYHFIRWASHPVKIYELAVLAFEGKYDGSEIMKWLKVFMKRFFMMQWKRSIMPDGPKVGSVSLSPRADWRMPSDAEMTLWMNALDTYENK